MHSGLILVIASACLLAGVGIGLVVSPVPDRDDEAAMMLLGLQSGISASLEKLENELAVAAYKLGATGLENQAARTILLEVSGIHPAVIDSTTVSPDGVIRAAEPAAYHGVVGMDVSDQKSTQHILATHRPIMSGIKQVAESRDASFISAPIFSRNGIVGEPPGRFIGFTSLVFKPDILIGEVAESIVAGTPYTVCVVDTLGRVLYDTDPDQIGLPLDDPAITAFPELVAFVTRVTEERQGVGHYSFRDERKESVWTTVSQHGTEWRVAVNRRLD